jgi:Xylanase inhibitor C-terminal
MITDLCSKGNPNRTCGGMNNVGNSNMCFPFTTSETYPSIEVWFESFPHLYMIFDPNAVIPLYPRDYIYKEGNNYCLGFSVLSSRIILGGLFMRNYDILFDRDNKVVKMTRSNCNPEAGFDFESYYIEHKDDPQAFDDSQVFEETSIIESPFSRIFFGLLSCVALLLLMCCVMYWRLYFNRPDSMPDAVNQERTIEILPNNGTPEIDTSEDV